jgi:hypothetical protein
MGANLDRVEAARAGDGQRSVDLTLDEHVLPSLGDVHRDRAGRASGLGFATFESAAQPCGRELETNVATHDVEIVNRDDEGAAVRHGASIKAKSDFRHPRHEADATCASVRAP